MKKTTEMQEVQNAAMREDMVVKVTMGGRNWRVNGAGLGVEGWVITISHPDFHFSRCEMVTNSLEFVIYTESEYARMVDAIRGQHA